MKNGLSRPLTTAAIRISLSFFGAACEGAIPANTSALVTATETPAARKRFFFTLYSLGWDTLCKLLYRSLLNGEHYLYAPRLTRCIGNG